MNDDYNSRLGNVIIFGALIALVLWLAIAVLFKGSPLQ